MTLSLLILLQFLIEPLQYFSIHASTGIPLYLGRIYTTFVIYALLSHSRIKLLLSSVSRLVTSTTYLPFVLSTVLSLLPALFTDQSPSEFFRFSVVEPTTNLIYLTVFVILPSLVTSVSAKRSLISIIPIYIAAALFIGYVDYIISLKGFLLLGRTIDDYRSIGVRYHSLFNEPRDYSVAGAYLLSLLHISWLFRPRSSQNIKSKTIILAFLLVLSLPLTVSLSFFLGLTATLIISFILFTVPISLKSPKLLLLPLSLVVLSLLLLQSFPTFFSFDILPSRLSKYYNLFIGLDLSDLQSITYGIRKSSALFAQASTFLPLFHFFSSFRSDNLLQFLFGYGHGSVHHFLTSFLYDSSALRNSYSAAVRLIFETGILGFLSFLWMYLQITLRAVNSLKHRLLASPLHIYIFIFLNILVLCMYLVQRRQELFLYLGVLNSLVIRPPHILQPSRHRTVSNA